jgi:hypothetical protein
MQSDRAANPRNRRHPGLIRHRTLAMPEPDRYSGIGGFRYRVFDGRLDSARAGNVTIDVR